MAASDTFYLCPTCFFASTQDEPRHKHHMLAVPPLSQEIDLRRPLMDAAGQLLTQAPRWFIALTHPLAAGLAQ